MARTVTMTPAASYRAVDPSGRPPRSSASSHSHRYPAKSRSRLSASSRARQNALLRCPSYRCPSSRARQRQIDSLRRCSASSASASASDTHTSGALLDSRHAEIETNKAAACQEALLDTISAERVRSKEFEKALTNVEEDLSMVLDKNRKLEDKIRMLEDKIRMLEAVARTDRHCNPHSLPETTEATEAPLTPVEIPLTPVEIPLTPVEIPFPDSNNNGGPVDVASTMSAARTHPPTATPNADPCTPITEFLYSLGDYSQSPYNCVLDSIEEVLPSQSPSPSQSLSPLLSLSPAPDYPYSIDENHQSHSPLNTSPLNAPASENQYPAAAPAPAAAPSPAPAPAPAAAPSPAPAPAPAAATAPVAATAPAANHQNKRRHRRKNKCNTPPDYTHADAVPALAFNRDIPLKSPLTSVTSEDLRNVMEEYYQYSAEDQSKHISKESAIDALLTKDYQVARKSKRIEDREKFHDGVLRIPANGSDGAYCSDGRVSATTGIVAHNDFVVDVETIEDQAHEDHRIAKLCIKNDDLDQFKPRLSVQSGKRTGVPQGCRMEQDQLHLYLGWVDNVNKTVGCPQNSVQNCIPHQSRMQSRNGSRRQLKLGGKDIHKHAHFVPNSRIPIKVSIDARSRVIADYLHKGTSVIFLSQYLAITHTFRDPEFCHELQCASDGVVYATFSDIYSVRVGKCVRCPVNPDAEAVFFTDKDVHEDRADGPRLWHVRLLPYTATGL